MKEEILTAKEWLEKENYYDDIFQETMSSDIMERYANYKTQILQAKILNFKDYIYSGDESVIIPLELKYLVKKYNEHFNITSVTEGEINTHPTNINLI